MANKFVARYDGTVSSIPQNVELDFVIGTATQAIDQIVWYAPYPCEVIAASVTYTTASTSGTLQLEKCPVGTAAGSGTDMLSTTVSLSSTAGTTNVASMSTTRSDRVLAATDRLALDFGGTVTNLVNCHINVSIKRLQSTSSFR